MEYATVEIHGGMSWKEISHHLKQEDNFSCSPARARCIFMKTMNKIAKRLITQVRGHNNVKLANLVSKDPRFHSGVGKILESSLN